MQQQQFGMGGCANGQCKNMRDVVARPSLYSGNIPGAGGPQTGRGPSQYNSHTGMSPQASFVMPQPPPVSEATAAYGYQPSSSSSSSLYSGRNPMQMPGSMQMQQPQQQNPMQMQQQQHQKPPCGCPTSFTSGFGGNNARQAQGQSFPQIQIVGYLVCMKCFAENHRLDQGDVFDANGNVVEPGCAKSCVAQGTPVGIFDPQTQRVTLLITRSPNLAPLMLNNTMIRVRGMGTGADVAQGGGVLVEGIDAKIPGTEGENALNWIEILVRKPQ